MTESRRRRPLIVAGLAVAVLGLLAMAVGERTWQLVLARIAIGSGTGVLIPTVRAIVAAADSDRLAENQGRLVVGEMFGFVVGPAVTALLADWLGLTVAFVVLAAALTALPPVVFTLPDLSPKHSRFERDPIRARLARPGVRGVVVMVGGYALGLGTLEAVLPLQISDLGVSTAGIGLFVAAFVVPIALSSVIGGRVADRLGSGPIAALGMLAGSVLFTLLGITPGLIWLGVVLALAGVADGFGFTASLAAAAAAARDQSPGDGFRGGRCHRGPACRPGRHPGRLALRPLRPGCHLGGDGRDHDGARLARCAHVQRATGTLSLSAPQLDL